MVVRDHDNQSLACSVSLVDVRRRLGPSQYEKKKGRKETGKPELRPPPKKKQVIKQMFEAETDQMSNLAII